MKTTNAKRLLTIALSAALVTLQVSPAFADITNDNFAAGGSGSSTATVDYVDPTTYIDIVVPTNNSLAFTLDPQNLAAISGVGTWDPSSGGTILPSAVGILVNKSAVPVSTSVYFSLADTSDDPVTLLSSNTDNAVNTGDDKNVFLTVTPASAKASYAAPAVAAVGSADPIYEQDAGANKVYTSASVTVAAVTVVAYADRLTAEVGDYVADQNDADLCYKVATASDGTSEPAYEQDGGSDKAYVSASVTVEAVTVIAYASRATAVIGDYVADSTDATKCYKVSALGDASPIYVQGTDSADKEFTVADLPGTAVVKEYADRATALFGQFVKDSTDATICYQVKEPVHAAFAEGVATTVSGYSALDDAAPVILSDAGTALGYVINKSTYYVSKTASGYSLLYQKLLYDSDDKVYSNDNYDTAAFLIGGRINKNADWSEYSGADAETLTLSATYTFTKLSDTEYSSATKLEDTYNSVAAGLPGIATAEYAFESSPVDVTVSLGNGSTAATDIASITYKDSENATQTLVKDTDYTLTSTTLEFTQDYIDSLVSGNVSSRSFTITFTNSLNTKATVTLSYSSAPGIATTAYTLSPATAVEVTYTLGSGSKAAEGIASIKDGATALDSDSYTIATATHKITFKAAYIDTLIGDGTTAVSKELKITFDDDANTYETITLSCAANAAPGIATTTYSLTAATAQEVTVSMGSGTLAAEGIASVNDNGTAIADTNYELDGNTLTFTAAYVSSIITDATIDATKTLSVVFDDDADTAVSITLNYDAPDTEPSIATTTYTMTSGTAVNVTVSLGSGEKKVLSTSGTNGITGITYLNSSSVVTPLTSNFTFTNGTLTFSASYVTTLITSLTTTGREYTITFALTDGTTITKKVTLNK